MSKTFHYGTRYSRYLANGKAKHINDIELAREAKRTSRMDPSCSYLLGAIASADGERTFEPNEQTIKFVQWATRREG